MRAVGLMMMVAGITATTHAQTVNELWATDTVLAVPESVLPHPGKDLLYVSLIDGQPAGKDGAGHVATVTRDGKIIQTKWATGLNAPKGMAIYKQNLYVSDLEEVVVIDVNSGKIKQRIGVKGATFLNDVTVDAGGLVYVTDSRANKVFVIANNQAKLLMDKVENANGILWQPEGLYILSKGSLLYRNNAGQVKTIATGMLPSTDGIERVNGKDFIISCWIGALYYVKATGEVTQLLDTQAQQMNTADIGYDDVTKTIYVPTFFKKSVIAYKLLLP